MTSEPCGRHLAHATPAKWCDITSQRRDAGTVPGRANPLACFERTDAQFASLRLGFRNPVRLWAEPLMGKTQVLLAKRKPMKKTDNTLVCPFLNSDPVYAFGVEFGMLYMELKADDPEPIARYFTIQNQDQILLAIRKTLTRGSHQFPWSRLDSWSCH